MAHPEEDNAIYWYEPDPRAIIPLSDFHVPKRLERTLKQGKFEVRFSFDFEAVMRACAESRPNRESTWISEDIIDVYTELHKQNFAESVETYLDGKLVGGVYGVSIKGLFAGESMFSRETDASKVALVSLLRHLKKRNYTLFDVQFVNPHLEQFGVTEIPRRSYQKRLKTALEKEVSFL